MVHLGGIGDFLLLCPALLRLAEQGPLELAGREERVALAAAAGIAQAVHGLDRVDFETVFHSPSDRLRRFLSRFDRAVLWIGDGDDVVRAVRGCGVEDVRAFPGLPPRDWARHASQYYLERLGLTESSPFRLDVAPAGDRLDVVVHPGSGSPRKRWPLAHFALLADRLRNAGRQVDWCLGPAEEGLPVPRDVRLIPPKRLDELASLLASAGLYLGNDSGITHLAASVGCRTVAVFGPTDPAVWGPIGPHVKVVRGDPWPTADTVWSKLPEKWIRR